MADNSGNSYFDEINRIYSDTNYFIDAITAEYGFYSEFIHAMRVGNATVSINRRTVHKKIEEQWMNAIEACLPTLDYVTRHYSVSIEEREEIVPIELSKRISSRSVRHLAQHTDYIKEFDGENITPSKILNVYNEETVFTYENKFLNTLILRLYTFVDKRYRALAGSGADETKAEVSFDSSFKFGSSEGKMSLKIEVTDPKIGGEREDATSRLKRLHETMVRYMDSPFVKMMENNYIHPPVMRTNAIQKNKYLHECLDLWDYVESYEKLGYIVESEEQAEKPNEEYIRELYSLMSLQYLMFDCNIRRRDAGEAGEMVAAKRSDVPIAPRLITHFQKVETKDYNSYDTEYRRVINITDSASGRAPVKGETEIKLAIDAALDADRELSISQKPSRNRSGKKSS